jgi:hypothetical protein
MAIEQTVVINTDTKSLADLRKEITSIQAQLDLTPTGTKEYDDLVVKLRQAKGEIKDFKEATKGLDPDQRAAKLVNAFQGMTGAIQSAAGALTLFGGNSEDLEKVEKNLLGIIAIGGGIQQTIEGYNDAIDVIGPKLSALGQSIKSSFTTASGAVNGFKVALAGIGIGLLITAVVLLADKLEGVDEASKKAAAGIAELAKKQKELRGELQALNETELETAERGLKETLELRKKISKDQTILFDDLNRAETESQKLAINERIKQKTLEYTQTEIDEKKFRAQIKSIQDQADKQQKADVKQLNDDLERLAKEKTAKDEKNLEERIKNEKDALLDLAEVERQFFLEQEKTDADRANREFTNTLERLREQKEAELNQLNLTETAKQAIRDKYNKLEILAEQKNAADLARIAAEANQKRLDADLAAIEKEITEFGTKAATLEEAISIERQRRFLEENRTVEQNLLQTLLNLDGIYQISRDKINETLSQTNNPEEKEELNKQLLALEDKYLDDRSNAYKKAATDIINIEELKAQKIAELDDIILDGTKSLLGDLSTLNQNYAQDNEAAQKQAFEQQKAFATVSAIIDTYLAAQKAFTSQFIPGDPSSLFRAQVAAGVAIATGLARVAVIRSQQFNNPNTGGGGGSAGGSVGGGGGGGAAGGGGGGLFGEFTGTVLPPRLAPPSGGGDRADTTGQFQQGGVTTPIVRAYVLSGDVTDAQTADIKLQQKRKL